MTPQKTSSSIFILAGFAPSLILFRLPLIEQLRAAGHRVAVGAKCAEFSSSDIECLNQLGVQIFDIEIDRNSIGIVRNLRTLRSMHKALKEASCDVLVAYTIIPVIFGTLAFKLAGYRHAIPLVTGLGSMFIGAPSSLRQRGVRFLVRKLYWLAFKLSDVVYFQNPDDPCELRRLGALPRNTEVALINGSGVDKSHFAQVLPPAVPGHTRFLMIARLLKDKGVFEYTEAAKALSKIYPKATFALIGSLDSNPTSVSADELGAWTWIEHQNWLDDVRPELNKCDVYVLPSYREGTPRSVLEAMSVGRPIVTTDAPGCRETVIDGVNGYLVPVCDAQALANAMEMFIKEPETISKMGKESRRIAVEKFDKDFVYKELVGRIGAL